VPVRHVNRAVVIGTTLGWIKIRDGWTTQSLFGAHSFALIAVSIEKSSTLGLLELENTSAANRRFPSGGLTEQHLGIEVPSRLRA
jgi:hypothetical protein